MRNFKRGLVSLDVFISYFIFGPMGEAAVGTFLTPDCWNIEVCRDMALVYQYYPNTLGGVLMIAG